MRASKHREYEDFHVYDLDVFYNGIINCCRVFLQYYICCV